MKFLRYGAGLLLTFCMMSQVQAANDWIHIASGSEHKILLNVRSVQETQHLGTTYVQAWVKATINNDLTQDGMALGDYVMTLYRVDCNAKTYGTVSETKYKKAGRVFGQTYAPHYVEMEHVIPDTIAEFIVDTACLANEIKQGRVSPEDDTVSY